MTRRDGSTVSGEQAVADAHPNGAAPWGWDDYRGKFETLASPVCAAPERARFIDAVQRLAALDGEGLAALLPVAAYDEAADAALPRGIFDHA